MQTKTKIVMSALSMMDGTMMAKKARGGSGTKPGEMKEKKEIWDGGPFVVYRMTKVRM